MSPARQPDRSPRKGRIAPCPPALSVPQMEPGAITSSLVATRKDDFDPHAFLATIGEGRKSVLFARKKRIFAQGERPLMQCFISKPAR